MSWPIADGVTVTVAAIGLGDIVAVGSGGVGVSVGTISIGVAGSTAGVEGAIVAAAVALADRAA